MDLRPLLEAAEAAFGLPAVVTLPDGTSVETVAIWLPPVTVDVPVGQDFRRAEARRVLALPRAAVPQIPRGAVVTMAEIDGGDEMSWLVDSTDRLDVDHVRCLMVPA